MKYIDEKCPFPEFIMDNKYNEFVLSDMKRDLKNHVNECENCLSSIPCNWIKSFLDLFVFVERFEAEKPRRKLT